MRKVILRIRGWMGGRVKVDTRTEEEGGKLKVFCSLLRTGCDEIQYFSQPVEMCFVLTTS